ncbi:MAG: GntR family transcriptional regulator [Syntrophomonas sp.]
MQFDSSQPIYQQIINTYKKQLARGELKEGDKIPSQREYAEKIQVNPNTVQRAYREMENLHMVETIRGQGTFIVNGEELKKAIKQEMAKTILDYFIQEMKSLGFTNEQMVEMLILEQPSLKEEK